VHTCVCVWEGVGVWLNCEGVGTSLSSCSGCGSSGGAQTLGLQQMG